MAQGPFPCKAEIPHAINPLPAKPAGDARWRLARDIIHLHSCTSAAAVCPPWDMSTVFWPFPCLVLSAACLAVRNKNAVPLCGVYVYFTILCFQYLIAGAACLCGLQEPYQTSWLISPKSATSCQPQKTVGGTARYQMAPGLCVLWRLGAARGSHATPNTAPFVA